LHSGELPVKRTITRSHHSPSGLIISFSSIGLSLYSKITSGISRATPS
jgi:hypothetical protein